MHLREVKPSLKIKPQLQKSPFVMNEYKLEVDEAFFSTRSFCPQPSIKTEIVQKGKGDSSLNDFFLSGGESSVLYR